MQINKRKMMLASSIVAICYMYVATLGTAFGFPIDFFGIMERRSQLLSAVVLLGVIYILSGRYFRFDKMLLSGFFLMGYMFLLGWNKHAGVLAWLSCAVMWYFILVTFFHLDVTENEIQKYALVFWVTSVLLSLLYIVGIITPGIPRTVANSNSIYYVLGAVPFLFLCKRRYMQWIGLLLASAAVIVSAKGTCLLAILCIWIIFVLKVVYFENASISKIITNIILLLLAIIVMWVGVSSYTSSRSIFDVFSGAFMELQSGGNGRLQIYWNTILAYMNASMIGQLFGHGYNAITAVLGIGTHNDFLMVLYDYGMVGFVLYIVFWVQLLKNAIYYLKAKTQMAVPYVCSVVVFFWISMASNVLNTQIEFLLLCMLWGLIAPKKYQKHGSAYGEETD